MKTAIKVKKMAEQIRLRLASNTMKTAIKVKKMAEQVSHKKLPLEGSAK
jgi:hypothetical protein